MNITIWRRHNRDGCDSKNRYDPRCGCHLWAQFVWKGATGVFEGKKLTYQNKWSLETRSWSEAQGKAKDLEKRLKDFADGKVSNKGISVEDAVKEWWALREQNKLNNVKAKLMGQKLIDCKCILWDGRNARWETSQHACVEANGKARAWLKGF